jgi:hypothetical protein
MKNLTAIFFFIFSSSISVLSSYCLEVNGSYDYFRGLPDGSWNGNNGALIGVNGGMNLFDCTTVQLGGSFGLYNWDGRGNLVFHNPKAPEEIGFITAGLATSWYGFSGGLVYDRMFTHHFSIYDLSPSIDQLRFQISYPYCSEEFGIWGTVDLSRSHKKALGLPIAFKAIGQMNLFWSHLFQNCAKTTVWAGLPYRTSLRFHHKIPGTFIAGFSFRVPLCSQLYLDGNGSYMAARKSHGVSQSRNYGANICVGITYLFSSDECCFDQPFMPIANHSNFFVDINHNQ